jgi:hypothetical protein
LRIPLSISSLLRVASKLSSAHIRVVCVFAFSFGIGVTINDGS